MIRKLTLLLIFSLTIISTVAAQDYIGASKCKMCHKSTSKGNQWGKWESAGHSKTLAILSTDEARRVAAERGIADPAKSGECLECHVTGWGKGGYTLDIDASDPKAVKKNNDLGSVGCEVCHGPGDKYKSMKIMKGLGDGSIDAASVAGYMVPTEATCRGCHNERSPSFEGFDFKERYAKIAHPNPKK